MKINPVMNSVNNFVAREEPPSDSRKTFSQMLSNLKSGKPADFDADKTQKTQTMIQILSDGSTLVTVYDADGKVISQTKTRAANPDPNAHVINTTVENNFGSIILE